MLFPDIRPFVRFCRSMQLDSSRKQGLVRTYDHRLFRVQNGRGSIRAGDTEAELAPGMLLYWPSGTPYRFLPEEGKPLELVGVNFDFTQAHSGMVQYLPMISENEYHPDNRLEDVRFRDAVCLNGVLILRHDAEIGPILKSMEEETCRPEAHSAFYLSSLMSAALSLLVRQADGSSNRKDAVRSILDYVRAHSAEPLSNQALGERFGYHPNYIGQLVRRHTGQSLHQYLLKLRIDQAVLLLSSTDRPVSDIAASVGFRNVSYFSHYFKQQTGYPPSALRVPGETD